MGSGSDTRSEVLVADRSATGQGETSGHTTRGGRYDRSERKPRCVKTAPRSRAETHGGEPDSGRVIEDLKDGPCPFFPRHGRRAPTPHHPSPLRLLGLCRPLVGSSQKSVGAKGVKVSQLFQLGVQSQWSPTTLFYRV